MKKSRYGAAFIILAALLFLFLVLNICIGSVNIPVSEIPKMLWGNGADETFTDIVMGIRFPRAMALAILGGGLALSGYLLQTFFHNPIAGPFTLGISSGAKTGRGTCHGSFPWKCPAFKFLGDDHGAFCWFHDLYGICDPYVQGYG